MDIIVCVKHVPEVAEAELTIEEGKRIKTAGLVFDINEWDNYALEEAILLKEKFGGSVTVITVGSEDADLTLGKCLAKGADVAIRLTDLAFEGSDSYAIAKILCAKIKGLTFDLILTGAQANDDGYAQVGVVLAELLGIPHASFVKKVEIKDGFARINRELEGGLEEVVEIKLPAVFTVQTGINEPRYVSFASIRRAMKKEIKVLGLKDLGLSEEQVGELGSWVRVESLFSPPKEKMAIILSGRIDEIASKIVEVIKSKGLL